MSTTFIFHCHGCGSILYEDPKPVLRDGTYRKTTYLETILSRIGGKCPFCGCELCSVPLSIEVVTHRLVLLHEKEETPPLRLTVVAEAAKLRLRIQSVSV